MPESRTTTYLASFRRDVADTLSRSEEEFGAEASDRYAALISRAVRDLMEDPLRPGTATRPMFAADVRIYHLAFSRDRALGGKVKSPRHLVLLPLHRRLCPVRSAAPRQP